MMEEMKVSKATYNTRLKTHTNRKLNPTGISVSCKVGTIPVAL